MIELLDPKKIDPIAYDEGILFDIREFSLLQGKRIGWNYCLDYTWIAIRCCTLLKPDMVILDIGCGPGAIHGYLEYKYGVNIIGIDNNRWEEDYVDVEGDFLDETTRINNGKRPGSIDLIISSSAFEHIHPNDHSQLVRICLDCLKSGGYLITTFTTTPWRTRRIDDHWDISKHDIEEIYGEQFISFEYLGVWWRWRKHREIPTNHKNRYGKWFLWDPRFLSVGADVVKK